MRVLITVSGIQDHIFAINAQSAGARLRGRSARLGLVIDYCLACLSEKYSGQFEVIRTAGSRLELDFRQPPPPLPSFLSELQRRLDGFSLEELRGEVWFTVAVGDSADSAHHALGRLKLTNGRLLLQEFVDDSQVSWNEVAFVLPPLKERRIDKDEVRKLPESQLGLALVRPHHRYLWLSDEPPSKQLRVKIVDRYTVISETAPVHAPVWTLGEASPPGPTFGRKRVARYAPVCGDRLCDLDEIGEKSSGAQLLGVLKGDLDNLGLILSGLAVADAKVLSERLEHFFTEDLNELIGAAYPDCYIVYSGGDDLFMLGPWDQLLRFINAFREKLKGSVESWGHPTLTLSAGFRLSHPKSPVRHLADDVERALERAKGKISAHSPLPPKNRFCAFERVLAWEDLHSGLHYADRFIEGVKGDRLSVGFLRRLQYYASEFRRFEMGSIDGLRVIPLSENDWYRNMRHLDLALRSELEKIHSLLAKPNGEGASAWRQVDFATHFALYAVRRKESSSNGR